MRSISCLVMLLVLFCSPKTALSQQTMPGRLPTSCEVEAQLLDRIADIRRATMTPQIIAGLTVKHCEALGERMAGAAASRDAGMPIDRQVKVVRDWYATRGRRETITKLPLDIEQKFFSDFIRLAYAYPEFDPRWLGRAVALDCSQSIPRAASPR